jgi:UDP-N-acetylglucosamine transferase subunit ALG13
LIFVCAGSREYQFNRLFQKIDELIEEGTIREEVFAQTGNSSYQPKHYRYRDYISNDEFNGYIETSRLIITHGGTGSIVGALKKGKKVIAVTRLSKYGEHVDDHQKQIVDVFSKEKYIYGIQEMEELREAIAFFDKEPCNINKFEKESYILNIIDEFISKNL